jgi:hypothetical protein
MRRTPDRPSNKVAREEETIIGYFLAPFDRNPPPTPGTARHPYFAAHRFSQS